MNFDQYREMLGDIMSLGPDEVLACDVETTGLRPFNGDVLRGVSVAYRDRSWYVPVSHPQSENLPVRPLVEALNRCPALRVHHHGKFDQKFLAAVGTKWPTRFADTMIVAWLLDENEPRALKRQANRFLSADSSAEQDHLKAIMKGETKAAAYKRLRAEGVPVAEAQERSGPESLASKKGWADLTYADVRDYAAKDAELTLRLWHHYRTVNEYARIEPALERHFALEALVYRMEHLGVQVNVDQVDKTRTRYVARMAEIATEFGDTSIDSPAQLAKLVYGEWGLEPLETTAGGAPSTSKSALELHAGAHPGLDLILEYRRLQKATATYFDALLEGVDADGRIHTSLNTTGTTTGRFSSSAPNLQNIPRDGTNSDVRDVFIAAPGYELWSFDMSQAELRIAASMAGEPAMLDEFLAGRDIYMRTAGELAIDRQTAKTIMLASQYGIGARKLARSLLKGTGRQPKECRFWLVAHEDRRGMRKCRACDSCRARDLLDNFWGSVPFLDTTNRQLIDFAKAAGYVPLHEPGRFRRYPGPAECRARGLVDWPKPYTATNAVVQGGCAEILKSWLLAAELALAGLGARMVLTVHDSLVVELAPGTVTQVQELLQTALDDVTPPGWVRIPIEPKEGV